MQSQFSSLILFNIVLIVAATHATYLSHPSLKVCEYMSENDRELCESVLLSIRESHDFTSNLVLNPKLICAALDLETIDTTSFTYNRDMSEACNMCHSVMTKLNNAFYCHKFIFKIQLAVHTCKKDEIQCKKFVRHNFQNITDLFFPSVPLVCKDLNAC